MILQLSDIIEPNTLNVICEEVAKLDFHSGQQTAGKAVRSLKNNQQILLVDDQPAPLAMLFRHLQKSPIFQAACLPKQFARVMLNRYQQGMQYGNHIDDAYIAGVRTDVSFTYCLSSTSDYNGGELVLCDSTGERSWKLDKGEVLIYPSSYLHRVNPVTEGTRIAMVGWLQSKVGDASQRELLFDLKQAVTHELETQGKSEQYDRLSKSYSNLLRMWAD
ncbi:Fe2+-dependent dioxygenase [Kangiella koreensis]|uniref:2OG-Fe(II) oxygenase n=1 Tax=Kangiella koreensis (strain DSM 16069 / JCM 12317 / KCTC 12182 / SW-125) TaxID=523791 RepID=C7R7F4_KANKD|nr:Fe2+-dependent dioxygenase [Kangiella koreensis]ACV25703.1 2OG-Fe(II) oxygenase [Kangiella koreensis DSM 16069]